MQYVRTHCEDARTEKKGNMMRRTWKDNADEFALLDAGEGWPFARLVACSVEKGKGNGRPPKTVTRVTVSGKVSAHEFPEEV